MDKKRSVRSYQDEIRILRNEVKFYEKTANDLRELKNYKDAFLAIVDSTISCGPNEFVSTKFILTKMRGLLK